MRGGISEPPNFSKGGLTLSARKSYTYNWRAGAGGIYVDYAATHTVMLEYRINYRTQSLGHACIARTA